MSGSMGDTLANALSSPGISALIGAAQGFGQAALPSRMPVPIGAALGMGLGGALQGQETGQKLQQGEQSLLGARMQNIATGSNLLPMLQTNKLKSDLLSNPAMLQQMMNGGQMPSGLMSSNGVMSGSDYASRVNLGENATGNPAAKNASGPGGTPTSSAVGNGQFLEGTWLPLFKQMYPSQAAGMSDDQILALRTDPAASSAMTQAYAKQNAPVLQQAQIQPTGANLALAHRFGPQGAVGLIGASPDTPVEKILPAAAIAANPTLKGKTAGQVIGSMTMQMGQAPVDFGQGTQVAGPGAGQTPAQAGVPGGQAIQQAPQPAQMAGQQAALPGQISPGAALALAQQYEQRANQIDQMNKLGLGFLAPGDAPALRTAAQQFRSIAIGGSTKAAEAPYNVQRVAPGGALFNGTGQVLGSVPRESHEIITTGPNAGMLGTVLRDPITGAIVGTPTPSGPAPTSLAPGAQQQAAQGGIVGAPSGFIPNALPPVLQEFQHERGETLAQQFNQIDHDAASAKEGNYLFDNLRNDSQSWQMGKFADWEGDARAWLSAVGHTIGIPDNNPDLKSLDQKLGDYQAFLKSSGSLLRTAVHDVSSRAAVQEYNLISQTLPHPSTSQQGFGQVADQWQGINDFRLAKQKFAQTYQSHPQDFNVDFNSQVSPVAFMLNRMQQTAQGQADAQAMFARLQSSPEGRQQISHIQQQYRYARDAGLFEGLPPMTAPPASQ